MTKRRALVIVAAAASGFVSAVAACSSFSPEEAPFADAAAPDRAPSGDDAAPSGEAGNTSRAGMVLVTGAGAAFFIDATEVTYGSYQAFRARSVTFGADSRCAWKTAASDGCVASNEALPITCVDWCDALAYCSSVGKRLCGAVGGGAVKPPQFSNAAVSQWLYACAGGAGTDRWAYGMAYEKARCNEDGGTPAPVGTHARCAGAVPGVFDLSGNVKEWEDGCTEVDGGPDATRTSSCVVRGGSFTGPVDESKCNTLDQVRRDDTYDDLGFRCCADP